MQRFCLKTYALLKTWITKFIKLIYFWIKQKFSKLFIVKGLLRNTDKVKGTFFIMDLVINAEDKVVFAVGF